MGLIRQTKQRVVIRKILEEQQKAMTAEDILLHAQKSIKNIGLATVYRTIKEYIEEGSISQVHIPGKTPLYEIAPKHHHHHFLCRICEKAFCLPSCPKGLKNMLPKGFVLEDHSVTLYGLCKSCQD